MTLEKKLAHYRISQSEYERVCEKLGGRAPEGVEWALFSALWSEHCSYKSTRRHLKKFAFPSKKVLESFGENAGVVDLGKGERIAFKMESHNHPSFISPHQGAATGVGGILRDIFTMGARPMALANYLCFGEPTAPRMPSIIDGVVAGIADYGNCVGVPTLTGQTQFHPEYNANVLVNAFALGYFSPEDKVFTSKAEGLGNFIVYVGAETGADGVHGASMASESFEGDVSKVKKTTVQIGDPFLEKLLIEACLEIMKEDLVVAIQDMGAAGLTSSCFEMASKGQVGFRLDLDKVPLRHKGLTPEEILLSESQERMLLLCEPKHYPQIAQIFSRWNLSSAVIGEVVEGQKIALHWHGELLTALSPHILVEEAPEYDRPFDSWSRDPELNRQPQISSTPETLLKTLLCEDNGRDRQWVYSQYDQRVGASTIRDCSEPVGVLRLPHSGRALGITLGCRPYLMKADAQLGAQDAIVYPALQLSAKGFTPMATTDCLNFGNPEKKIIMSQLVTSIEALAEASKTFDIPVISGNVSLYNETEERNIIPTPSTALVGLKDPGNIPYGYFHKPGAKIYLLENIQVQGLVGGAPAAATLPCLQGLLSYEPLKAMMTLLQNWVTVGDVISSRVVGKYGLAYNLARMTSQGVGALIQGAPHWKKDKVYENYFWEKLYQVILISPKTLELKNYANTCQLSYIGETHEKNLVIEPFLKLSVSQISQWHKKPWEGDLV